MAGTPVFNMADNCLQYCKIDKVEGHIQRHYQLYSERDDQGRSHG